MEQKSKKVKPNISKLFKFAALFILFVVSLIMIAESYEPAKDNSQILLSYSTNNKANYRVNLKENNFYEEKTLGMNKRYVASLIDSIDIDFMHSLSGSDKMDLNYSYTISAYISSVFNDSNNRTEIWRKNYNLADTVNKSTKNANSYTVNETVNVDYSQYNKIANDYKSTLSLPVESYLYVVMNITTNGNISNSTKTINENNKLEVKIPLTVSTLAIETDYPNNQIGSISSDNTSKWNINFILLALGIALLIVTVIPAYKAYDEFKKYAKASEFSLKLKKILKDYEEIIAEVAELPSLEQYQVIDVKVFRDMVDIQAELHVPILYYELTEAIGGVFLIIHENKAYRYYVREDGYNNTIA